MATETLLTLEQFDRLPEKEGVLYELSEGELVVMTEPMPRHNIIRDNIAAALREFVHRGRLGKVLVETGYRLAPETVPIPDVSFVPADRSREIALNRSTNDAPVPAAEAVSPTDLAEDRRRKVAQYLAAAARALRGS